MLCYQCQGTGRRIDRPGWPCPLCNGQCVLDCCEGDQEQPEALGLSANPPSVPPNGAFRNQVERVRAQRLSPLGIPAR
jgi:hypothetical protein